MKKEEYFDQNNICVEDDRFILRRMDEEDKLDYFQLFRETSMFRNIEEQGEIFNFDRYMEYSWELNKKEDAIIVSIIEKDTDEFVGYVNLRELESRTPEIGVELLEKYRRQGIASTVIPLFTKQIKTIMPLDYFMVRIKSDNVASQKLFEKLGVVEIDREPSEYRTFLNEFKDRNPEFYKEKITEEMEEIANRTWIVCYKY